jgi:selenocysteine lyase/cysteine desulfurase
MTEQYFRKFRENIIGLNQEFTSVFGTKRIIYSDWTASGRLYGPIEERISQAIGSYVANTHTETSITGCAMTQAYQLAKKIIKKHVNAKESDILISSNAGMTGVTNKFQRILGLKIHEKYKDQIHFEENDKPVVFISHMEHHSNQTSWLETVADVEIIKANDDGLMCLNHFAELLEQYKNRKTKFAAITSCSNVTGIITPYHDVAKMIHKEGGFCFVDFAASAPYIEIDMHPEEEEAYLDAIYFSPHKFLGGPGSSGILIFNPALYTNKIPDNPGGGTVDWTNPWGEHKYHDEIEEREDGGTPSFLQTMKVALCTKLKDEMGVQNILFREHAQLKKVWKVFDDIPNLHVLAENARDRLGIISFYIDELHHNLAVKLLNDHFGIQMRGGCSCAGTYGHYLLKVSKPTSHRITHLINQGDLTVKPGWVRMSVHPIMTDDELDYILDAVKKLAENHKEWAKEYEMDIHSGEFFHFEEKNVLKEIVGSWFDETLSP